MFAIAIILGLILVVYLVGSSVDMDGSGTVVPFVLLLFMAFVLIVTDLARETGYENGAKAALLEKCIDITQLPDSTHVVTYNTCLKYRP